MSGNKLVQLLNQYGHEHTILETGKVLNISPITTGQMKGILQYEGSEDPNIIEQVLDDIILGCVNTEGFDLDVLTLQDRFELLIGIRKISKGSVYNFNIKCPQCGSESIQAIDLDELKMVPFPVDTDKTVKINDNLTVTFDFVRRSHQKQSVELVDKMPKMSESQERSEVATYMYAFGMVGFTTPQGALTDISIDDKKEFLDTLSATDYENINGWFEKNNYGTEFKYQLKCKAGSCDFTADEDIPMTGFFF